MVRRSKSRTDTDFLFRRGHRGQTLRLLHLSDQQLQVFRHKHCVEEGQACVDELIVVLCDLGLAKDSFDELFYGREHILDQRHSTGLAVKCVSSQCAHHDLKGKLGFLSDLHDRVHQQLMDQMGDHIDQDNLVIVDNLNLCIEILELDDCSSFKGPHHHGLVLKDAPVDRLYQLLGDSVVLGHEKPG